MHVTFEGKTERRKGCAGSSTFRAQALETSAPRADSACVIRSVYFALLTRSLAFPPRRPDSNPVLSPRRLFRHRGPLLGSGAVHGRVCTFSQYERCRGWPRGRGGSVWKRDSRRGQACGTVDTSTRPSSGGVGGYLAAFYAPFG